MGPVGIGAAALGGGVSALGQLFGGGAQSSMYKYQAGVAQMNAQIARQNAEYSIRTGETEALQSGWKSRFQGGEIKAAQGRSNLDVSSGSARQVQESQHMVGQIDQNIIRENAGRRAYGYLTEAASQDAQAKADTAAAKTSQTASYIGAAGTLIGTAGSVASKWMQASQYGMFGGGDQALGSDAWSGPGYDLRAES